MPSPASGARTLLGLKIDRQIPGQQLGCPEPVITPIAAPDPPTVETGGAGNITGASILYKMASIYAGLGESAASVASASVGTAPTIDLVTAPVGTPAGPAATGDGTYSGVGGAVFDVVIDSLDSPATFKWRKNGGSWTAGVPTTDATPIMLSDGISVSFAAPGTFGYTLGDAWTITITVTAGAGISPVVTPAVSPTPAGAVVLGRVFYRSIDGGPYGEVKRLWTNDTTPFDDDVAPGAEGTRTPRTGTTGLSAEQTAGNYGFQFVRPDSGTDFNRDDTSDKSTEQTGQLGEPRGIPGLVKYAHPYNFDVRSGTLVPLFASMAGKPTVSQNAGEPVVVYAFPLSDLESDSISLSGLFHKGGNLRPGLFLGMKCSEIDLSLGKKQAQGKAKLTGQHDTECGFGKALTGNTGTFASLVVPRGVRSGANAYTDSVFVKIVTAPAVVNGLGSFTIRAAIAAAGGTPSFGTAVTSTVYYDPATKRQIHPAAIGNMTATAQQSAWIELWESTTSLALGFDEGENRKPFEVYFPGDVTALAAGDVFEIPALQPVPNVYTDAHPTGPDDDGSYTGQRPRFTNTSRLTPAHVIITRGSGPGAQVILDAQSASLKFGRPIDAVEGMGPEAANPTDVDVFGKFTFSFDVERRFVTREFERAAKSDARLYTVVKLQSHRIVVDPVSGTLSADREGLAFTFAQSRVDKTASPFSGDKATLEKITLIPEQPDDDSLNVTGFTLRTAHSWDFSRV